MGLRKCHSDAIILFATIVDSGEEHEPILIEQSQYVY